jgi:transcriptional regulator with GAF, ATPase, and Fis domain
VTETSGRRLGDALTALAYDLLAGVGADACMLSRIVGDVLLVVARTIDADQQFGLGQSFLVSDYPATARVLAAGEPTALTLADDGVDDQEAELLRALGFSALLMLPFDVAGARWGLVELYRRDARPFGPQEIETARSLAHID